MAQSYRKRDGRLAPALAGEENKATRSRPLGNHAMPRKGQVAAGLLLTK
jgi:hypothetical protein